MNWRFMFKRELKLMFVKDVRRAAFILGAALTYLTLFALLYGPHVVKNVPLIVYDENQTALSRSLVQAFADSERFEIAGFVSAQEEMEQRLRDKDAFAALHIPARFSQDVKAGVSSPVLVVVNAANLLIANTATTTAQEIIAEFSRQTGAALAAKSGLLPAQGLNRAGPIEFGLRVLNNPTLSYLDFFVIGLAMAALQQGIFLAVGASIIGEYRDPAMLGNLAAGRLLAGKLLPYWLCGTTSFFLAVTASTVIFDIPCKGGFADLLLLAAVFTFTAIGFGTLLAALCDDEVSFTKAALTYAVPGFILSGHIWPQYSMDLFSQLFAYTFPLYYFADAVRDLMLTGHSPLLYRNVAVLTALGLLFISLAARLLKRRAQH